MTDLHRRAIFPLNQFTLVNTTTTDTGSRKNSDDTVRAYPGTKPVLAKHANVDIVADDCRTIEFAFQRFLHRDVIPTQIRSFVDHALLDIQRTRTSDPDTAELFLADRGVVQRFTHDRYDSLQTGLLAFVPFGLLASSTNGFEVPVKHHGQHLRAAQIETDPVIL